MSVVGIASDRIEIGEVAGLDGARIWMMFVIERDEGHDTYAEQYATREEAVEAAKTWGLPIRFIHKVGSTILTGGAAEGLNEAVNDFKATLADAVKGIHDRDEVDWVEIDFHPARAICPWFMTSMWSGHRKRGL